MSGVLHGVISSQKYPGVALLRFNANNNSTTFYDDSAGANWAAVGSAKVSTAQSKFGGSSFTTSTATNSYIKAPNSSLFSWGTSDFTIEFWAYATNFPNFFFDTTPSGSGYQQFIFIENTGELQYFSAGSLRINGGNYATYNTWRHIAVCRASGSTRMFLDGNQVGSTYTDSTSWSVSSDRPVIGAFGTNTNNGSYFLRGYIDDFRITKQALYTANFTPPGAL